MNPSAPRRLFFLIAMLAATASAFVGISAGQANRIDPRTAEFQTLVGGLGFGGEADLSRCALGMDPRIQSICDQAHGPLPGGAAFCECHAFSILHLSPAPSLHLETQPHEDAD